MTTSPPAGAAATGAARTIFFGSGPFAVPMLEALLEIPVVQVVAVVTVPDRPSGRGKLLAASPVARAAAARNITLLQPPTLRDEVVVQTIAATDPTLGVLADYGRIVPASILDLAPRGFLNVHPSLLPRHRGASPIPAAILAGDPESGVTIIAMDAGLDTGPIVASEAFRLGATDTAVEVERAAAAVGARLLAATVPEWLGGDAVARPQGEDGATLTRPLRREDGRLDGFEPAAAGERRVRALEPWPGTFIETGEATGQPGRVAVLRAAVAASEAGDEPGVLVADGDGVALATTDGRLRLLDVRPAGGRAMTGAEWRRGRPKVIGASAVSIAERVPA